MLWKTILCWLVIIFVGAPLGAFAGAVVIVTLAPPGSAPNGMPLFTMVHLAGLVLGAMLGCTLAGVPLKPGEMAHGRWLVLSAVLGPLAAGGLVFAAFAGRHFLT